MPGAKLAPIDEFDAGVRGHGHGEADAHAPGRDSSEHPTNAGPTHERPTGHSAHARNSNEGR